MAKKQSLPSDEAWLYANREALESVREGLSQEAKHFLGSFAEHAADPKAEIYICRHGATKWSLSGQHTSHTDLILTPEGIEQATRLGKRLCNQDFDLILSSPLKRAKHTCELAGFKADEICDDLLEWDYGDYEGLTTPEIREQVPDWTIFEYGAPGGESVADVQTRADRLLERAEGRTLIFCHGHFSRVLAARWIGLPASAGRHFDLATGSLSILGWVRNHRAIKLWNEISFLD